MPKTQFPIIVRKLDSKEWSLSEKDGEKGYQIFCMAPFVNAFNEVIRVDLRNENKWGRKPKMVWTASKGSSGSIDETDTKLVAEGYALAVRLMKGDESVVTPEKVVKKFLSTYHRRMKARERYRRNRR